MSPLEPLDPKATPLLPLAAPLDLLLAPLDPLAALNSLIYAALSLTYMLNNVYTKDDTHKMPMGIVFRQFYQLTNSFCKENLLLTS
jgi:hypothetical protein